MANKMVWDSKQGKMVKPTRVEIGNSEKVAISAEQFDVLRQFAKEDGFDLTGVSYVTIKDANGKTKKDKDGKPIFKMVNGKKETITVAESKAKLNDAVASYVSVAVNMLIAYRAEVAKAEK